MVEVYGPISYPKETELQGSLFKHDSEEDELNLCLLCDSIFNLPSDRPEFLNHLFYKHCLVIADIHSIASFKRYLDYWRARFVSYPFNKFCTTLMMDTKPDGRESVGEKYYLLSDVFPEDRLLRNSLQEKRQEWVLKRQTMEKVDATFTRTCLFCNLNYKGIRTGYLKHLSRKHNLLFGCYNHLVFIDKMLETVEEKKKSLQCLYCEESFKNESAVKKHVRQKFHIGINYSKPFYEKFNIINYLKEGKSILADEIQSGPNSLEMLSLSSENDDITDEEEIWNTDHSEETIMCLFCDERNKSFAKILEHMTSTHDFDFIEFCEEQQLDTYNEINVVNYVRRKISDCSCFTCSKKFSDVQSLLNHMKDEGHSKLPPVNCWNQPDEDHEVNITSV